MDREHIKGAADKAKGAVKDAGFGLQLRQFGLEILHGPLPA